VRTRSSKTGRVVTEDERRELQRLLAQIPVGTEYHDPRIVAFFDRWYSLHVVNAGPIHLLRCTPSASADLLESIRTTLADPALRIRARHSCECELCLVLRGEELLAGGR
jgi:hypothetical protein